MLVILLLLFPAGALATPRLRQMSSIPSACTATCTPVTSVFDACLSGNMQTCLGVCAPSTFSQFSACLTCVAGADGISASDKTQLQQVLDSMTAACAELNSMGGVSAGALPTAGGASGTRAAGNGTAASSGAGASGASVSVLASASGASASASASSASGSGVSAGAGASGGGGVSVPSPSVLLTKSGGGDTSFSGNTAPKVTGPGTPPPGATIAKPNSAPASATTATPLLLLSALLAAIL